MSVLAIDQLTTGLERKRPSFFGTLSVLWTSSVLIISLAVLIVAAKVSANWIDREKQALAVDTMDLVEIVSRDMDRANPHEFVAKLAETGQFDRIGIYCILHGANFEARDGNDVVKSPDASRQALETVAHQTAVTTVSASEIVLSRPLYSSSGRCDGAVYMAVERANLQTVLLDLTRQMAPFVLAILALGLFACTALAHRLTAPLRSLNAASCRIADGDLDADIRTDGPSEFQALARSVSSIVGTLRTSLDKVQKLSFVDSVTNLPNRAAFHELGDSAAKQARERTGSMIALMYIDIDDFHEVNNRHGSEVGDGVLRHLADLLTETLRETDQVLTGVGPDAKGAKSTPARIGGDQFTILLTGLERALDAEIVAQRILNLAGRPFRVDEINLTISVSIGVAFGDPEETDVPALLSKAHSAMQTVKEFGKNSFHIHTKSDEQDGDDGQPAAAE
ncbi:MAG: sensor domain-containing diguanylate cyclase [Pseudomonadota bacterium]